jgi:threonine/homoserine/homoserine lactone efflux protein
MLEVYSLIAGIAIGLSLAVPPGPMNALIAAESVKRSYLNGIKLGMGAMTADAIFLFITLIGVSVLFTGDLVKMIVSAAGGIILAYMAIGILKSFNKPLDESGKEVSKPYLTGLVVGISNPSQILWWITAGAALITNFNAEGIVGFFIGIVIWVSLFSVTLHFAQKKAEWLYPAITLISGIVLLFFSLLLTYSAIRLALGVIQ